MTKVIILGQEPKEEKKLKPIEFTTYINSTLYTQIDISSPPRDWANVVLICRNWGKRSLDLFYAYDDDVDSGCLYLGHFNDGVVE